MGISSLIRPVTGVAAPYELLGDWTRITQAP